MGGAIPTLAGPKRLGVFLKKYVNPIILYVSGDEIESFRTEIVDLIGFPGSNLFIHGVFVDFGFLKLGSKNDEKSSFSEKVKMISGVIWE